MVRVVREWKQKGQCTKVLGISRKSTGIGAAKALISQAAMTGMEEG